MPPQASGKGRTGDSTPGDQDEIDIEWKGNTPTQIQTNVYLSGSDQAQVSTTALLVSLPLTA